MCDNFDDDGFDVEDTAFWFGIIETLIKGGSEELVYADPASEDTLKTDLHYRDEDNRYSGIGDPAWEE